MCFSVWNHDIFITRWVKIQYNFIYLYFQIVLRLAIGNSYCHSLCVYLCQIPGNVASSFESFLSTSFSLFYFHTVQVDPGSFSIFPVTILESSFFPWNPCSFYCRIVLTKLDLCPKCAHWYWRVFASGHRLVDRAKNYMCTS